MLCRIRVVHIQLWNRVLDDAECTAPTRQHELDRIEIRSVSALKDLDHEAGIDQTDQTDHTDHADHTDRTHHLSDVCNVLILSLIHI